MRSKYGQNFILDKGLLEDLVADRVNGKNVLEVGPGHGTLTSIMLERCKKLICIENDRELFKKLQNRYELTGKINVIYGDFLRTDIDLGSEKWVFFANIPYFITTPIIKKLLRIRESFTDLYMMVQYEFALRLFADPGNKQYGSLSVYFQNYFSGSIIKKIPKRVFVPSPKVDSAFINFYNDVKSDMPDDFFRFVQGLFSQRRKTILNGISNYYENFDKNAIMTILKEKGINANERVENLSNRQLADLYSTFKQC